MEADGAVDASLSPAERLKMMDLRPRPWPKAAEDEPGFVRCGNPLDIALKKSLGAILSSKMVVLNDLGGTSYSDEARWRKEQWLPPKSGHSKSDGRATMESKISALLIQSSRPRLPSGSVRAR